MKFINRWAKDSHKSFQNRAWVVQNYEKIVTMQTEANFAQQNQFLQKLAQAVTKAGSKIVTKSTSIYHIIAIHFIKMCSKRLHYVYNGLIKFGERMVTLNKARKAFASVKTNGSNKVTYSKEAALAISPDQFVHFLGNNVSPQITQIVVSLKDNMFSKSVCDKKSNKYYAQCK